MAMPIYILGGHQTDFAKVWSRKGQDLSDIVRESTLGAIVGHREHPRRQCLR
jgi:acetyl-CoA C-acetyltransferase